jgi:hypothetical protein
MSVEIGNRYTKTDGFWATWVVTRLVKGGSPVPHVVLADEVRPDRETMLSVPALETTRLFTLVG